MSGEWKNVELGTVAKVRSGYAFKSSDMGVTGYPIVKIRNVVPPTIEIQDCDRIPDSIISRIPRIKDFEIEAGDILIAMTGATVGKVGRFPDSRERFYLNQRVGKVQLVKSDSADYRYLYYILSQDSYIRQMAGTADGSAQANISSKQIESLEIPLPPLPEQRRIAKILGDLDDKIELNRNMNETLEQMARALFKSWFIDFDPVRAKMEGRQPEGMDAETAALFPSRLVESDLGLIPDGWEVKALDRIASFLNGLALQKYPPSSGQTLKVIKIAQLRSGNTFSADECSSEIPSDYVIEDGDVLFSWSGSLEVEIWCGGVGALNQHLFKVTSDVMPSWFCYQWLRHFLPVFREIAADKATTMGHIQRKHLSETLLILPGPELLGAMTSAMMPIHSQLINNNIKSRTLASLRDTLLPQLMRGWGA
jgi:type I restriction enzyme S subunit